MTDIIDLNAKRNEREQPDAEHMRRDDFGRPLYEYALHYRFAEGRWGATIWAYSMEDAAARVAAMRESLELDGQIFTSLPA